MSTLNYNEVVSLLAESRVARYSVVERNQFLIKIAAKGGLGVAILSFLPNDSTIELEDVALEFADFGEMRARDASTAEANMRVCSVRYGKYAISDLLLNFLKNHALFTDGKLR